MVDYGDAPRIQASEVALNPVVGAATNVQAAIAAGYTDLAIAAAHLNAAKVGTLKTAPTLLVAAPGAGKALAVVNFTAEWVQGVDGFVTSLSPGLFYTAAAAVVGNAASQDVGGLSSDLLPRISRFGVAGPLLTTVSEASSIARTIVANQPLVVGQPGTDPPRAGPIVTATLAAGGTGYVVNDTGTVDQQNYTGGAAYRVSAVAPVTGAVTAFVITAPGDGYDTLDNPVTTTAGGGQPGVGTGLTVNVAAIPPADGDLYVTALYRVITLH